MTVTSGHHGLGTLVFGSLGGIQARNLLSSSTVHQRIMSVGWEPLVEEGGGMGAHMRQAFPFSLKQRHGQRRARQQNQEDDIQVDQQSGTNRASPATIPQRLMLRVKTSRKIRTTLVTDSPLKVRKTVGQIVGAT